MHYLIASLISLTVGPILHHGLRRQAQFLDGLSAFVVVTLVGLIGLDVLPGLWQQGGLWILPFLLLGIAGPTLVEKAFSRYSSTTHRLTLLLGMLGLLLHTLTDGSAMALTQASPTLAMSVVLHRLPAGLAVWWLLRPAFGRSWAATMLALMMAFTVLGFLLAEPIQTQLAANQMLWLQAFVTGSLVHVVLHRPHEHHEDHRHGPSRLQLRPGHYLGAALGLLLLVLLLVSHGHQHHQEQDLAAPATHHSH